MSSKTKQQMETEAAQLEAQAGINDAYRSAMERTTERTGGRLGHLNAPMAYAAHGQAAADKRKRAADLRAAAAKQCPCCETASEMVGGCGRG